MVVRGGVRVVLRFILFEWYWFGFGHSFRLWVLWFDVGFAMRSAAWRFGGLGLGVFLSICGWCGVGII